MEQQIDQHEQRAKQQQTEALAIAASVTPAASPTAAEVLSAPAAEEDLLPPVTDMQGLVRELAERIGEASGQIVIHRDLSTLLERMRDGVVVQLSISRPRFFKRLSLEDLGVPVASGQKPTLRKEGLPYQDTSPLSYSSLQYIKS